MKVTTKCPCVLEFLSESKSSELKNMEPRRQNRREPLSPVQTKFLNVDPFDISTSKTIAHSINDYQWTNEISRYNLTAEKGNFTMRYWRLPFQPKECHVFGVYDEKEEVTKYVTFQKEGEPFQFVAAKTRLTEIDENSIDNRLFYLEPHDGAFYLVPKCNTNLYAKLNAQTNEVIACHKDEGLLDAWKII